MKKLTEARKKRLLRRSRNEKRRKEGSVKLATFHTENGPLIVEVGSARAMPKILCLNIDVNGTVNFFDRFRSDTMISKARFSRIPTSKKRGRIKLLRNYFDFEPITTISPGAALIMAAEFDRIYAAKKFHPSPINIEKWDDQIYGTLFHLGFFKLMGFTDNQIRKQAAMRPPQLSGLTIMPMVSGDNTDVSEAQRAEIINLFSVVGADQENSVKLSSSIVDAIENVVSHAYDDLPINHRKLIPRKWWISGSASKETRRITFSIFDQGVSIPFSLPVRWGSDKLFAKVLSKFGVGPWKDKLDDEAIKAALFLSTTATGNASRGKGLHKIKETVTQLKDGSLIILSRRGYYKWENQIETGFVMESPLMGTYVELQAAF
jgi:hypothetical protein